MGDQVGRKAIDVAGAVAAVFALGPSPNGVAGPFRLLHSYVPGFDGIRVNFEVDADASEDDIAAIVAQSQKRSAVFDIITNPTDVVVTTGKA